MLYNDGDTIGIDYKVLISLIAIDTTSTRYCDLIDCDDCIV